MSDIENQNLTSPDQDAPTTSERLTAKVMETVANKVTVEDSEHLPDGRLRGMPVGPGQTAQDVADAQAPEVEATADEQAAEWEAERDKADPQWREKAAAAKEALEIGRASCRERVCLVV